MEKRGARTTYGNLKIRKFILMNQMDVELENGNLISRETLNEFHRTTINLRAAERRLLKPIVVSVLLAVLLLFSSGCTSSATLGVSSSLYYPREWESPASRKQHTQPTVGMARNNLPMVGGSK